MRWNFNENNLIQFLKIYFSEEEVQSVIFAIQTWNIKALAWFNNFLADQLYNKIMTGKVMLLILKLAKSKSKNIPTISTGFIVF
jgi:hypothetical protein